MSKLLTISLAMLVASTAHATCKYMTPLVHAYVECADPGNTTHTDGASPANAACNPAQRVLSSPFSIPLHSDLDRSCVIMARTSGDIRVKARIFGVNDGTGPFTGTLTLRVTARVTDNNRCATSGQCTTEDVPVDIDVPCTGGVCFLPFTAGQTFDVALGYPLLAPLADTEVQYVAVEILDPSDQVFLKSGQLVP